MTTPEDEIQSHEVKALAAGSIIAEAGSAQYQAWVEYMTGNLREVHADLIQARLDEYVAALQRPPTRKELESARRVAAKEMKLVALNMLGTEVEKITKVVADGLAQGKGPLDIARMLDDVKGLDKARAARYAKMVEYLESTNISDEMLEKQLDNAYKKELAKRKETIARTEANRIVSVRRDEEAQRMGAKWKGSITAGDARVSDICEANEAKGVIPYKEQFPSGHNLSPFHVNCRDSIAYFTNDKVAAAAGARAKKRAAAVKRLKAQAKLQKSAA